MNAFASASIYRLRKYRYWRGYQTFAIGITKANRLRKQVHNSKLHMPRVLTTDLTWGMFIGDLTDDRITEIEMS